MAAAAARYGEDLGRIQGCAQQLAALEAAARQAQERYRVAATALSGPRRSAAEKLDRAVGTELKPLKLERARFSTEITTDAEIARPARHRPHRILGADRSGHTARTADEDRLRRRAGAFSPWPSRWRWPIADRLRRLVFDEVYTGVGGAVADAIGVRLARLARRAQVVAVTHAPQVALPTGIC